MIRFANFILRLFGMYFHWQNLNEDDRGRAKGLAFEGRAHLQLGRKRPRAVRFEWNLWTHFCGVSVKRCGDSGGLTFHVAFPPFSFWLTLPIARRYTHAMFFSLGVHDAAIWWQFGGDTMEWSSRTPKWKHGSFNLANFFLGRVKHSTEVLSTHQVLIPMPEGAYPATVVLERSTWKRPRWFATVGRYADVKIAKGIPHQGKGENSWDCGEDRLFGRSCKAETLEQAIAGTVETALRSRRRYDGNVMASYPTPLAAQ